MTWKQWERDLANSLGQLRLTKQLEQLTGVILE